MMLVNSAYYKARFEKRVWPWQDGYWSYKIAQQARGGHSHEELEFDKTVIEEYCKRNSLGIENSETLGEFADIVENICFSSSERDGGCRFRYASDIFKNPDKWDIVPTTDDMDKAIKMLEFCIKQDGKGYDWAGISGFVVYKINQNPDKWYCNEVCDTAKGEVGLWPENIYRMHPSVSYEIQRYLFELKGL